MQLAKSSLRVRKTIADGVPGGRGVDQADFLALVQEQGPGEAGDQHGEHIGVRLLLREEVQVVFFGGGVEGPRAAAEEAALVVRGGAVSAGGQVVTRRPPDVPVAFGVGV